MKEHERRRLLLLKTIAGNTGLDGNCYLETKVLAEKIGVSDATIVNYLLFWEANKYIERPRVKVDEDNYVTRKICKVTDKGLEYLLSLISSEQEQALDKKVPEPKKKKERKTIVNKYHLELAKTLAAIVKKHRNVQIKKTAMDKWAEDIAKLQRIEKVSLARQRKILKWYSKVIGGQFIPVVESGDSFRRKFTRLEDAKHREKQDRIRSTTKYRKTKKRKKKSNKKKKNEKCLLEFLKKAKITITIE